MDGKRARTGKSLYPRRRMERSGISLLRGVRAAGIRSVGDQRDSSRAADWKWKRPRGGKPAISPDDARLQFRKTRRRCHVPWISIAVRIRSHGAERQGRIARYDGARLGPRGRRVRRSWRFGPNVGRVVRAQTHEATVPDRGAVASVRRIHLARPPAAVDVVRGLFRAEWSRRALSDLRAHLWSRCEYRERRPRERDDRPSRSGA